MIFVLFRTEMARLIVRYWLLVLLCVAVTVISSSPIVTTAEQEKEMTTSQESNLLPNRVKRSMIFNKMLINLFRGKSE